MSRPRVPALAALAAASLVLALAGPALAGGKPDHSKAEPIEGLVFDAGFVCDFAVQWDILPNLSQVLVFPVQANGDQLVRQTGRSVTVVTNLDTGDSLRLNTSDRQDLLFHADGTVDVTITGLSTAAYFPTDPGGPAQYAFTGHLHDVVDSSFTLLTHEFNGRFSDVCAALT